MDVDAYLNRIRYQGPRHPDAKTLSNLHRAHLLAVPFENLDIGLHRPIILDEGSFFQKIVLHSRGGFCYELNGLFAALLRELHFTVSLLSARVFNGATAGPEFDHLTLLVDTGERWLADVGFGDSFIEPLSLDDLSEQVQRNVGYRIEHAGDSWHLYSRQPTGASEPVYAFTLEPRGLEDFSARCAWQQTSSESHFTQKRICTIATPDGRVTLSDSRLIITQGDRRTEHIVADNEEYRASLRNYFGVDLVPRHGL
jgi:N-hydroxyarylamine O-acetyltransferase